MEKLIEETVLEAEQAAEPGTMTKGQTIEGDVPMTTMDLKSAGYVYVYDTRTGERSICNRNMLTAQLKKKRPDGSNVFTTANPGIEVKRGTYKCMLHPDGPNRAHYDELGLAVCRKANLTSPFQVKRHMQKRHHVEWETLEEERKDMEKQEDREFQRRMLEGRSEKPPLYVSDKDKKRQGVGS